jgi:hypothetical protein
MYIPSELAYGDRGSPPKIGGGDVLIFIMEILSIDGETTPALKCNIDTIITNSAGGGTTLSDRVNGIDIKSIYDIEDEKTSCTGRELEYIKKISSSLVKGYYRYDDDDDKRATIKKNLKRIESILKDGKMKDSLRNWAKRRKNILNQFLSNAATKIADEL